MRSGERSLWLGIAVGAGVALVGLLCLGGVAWLFLGGPLARQEVATLPPPPTAGSGPLATVAATTATPIALPTTIPMATTTALAPASPLPAAPAPAGEIAFVCFVEGVDQICRVNADGSDYRQLTFSSATDFYPEWGPGRTVITFSSRRSGEFNIYLMGADGSNQRRISSEIGSLFAPAISPEGGQIAFTNALGRYQNIWIMNADGTNPRALTTGPFNDVDPAWSPDGSQLSFASDRNGFVRHYVMDADGGNMRLLSDEVEQHGGRSDWSPDGRWLAFYAGPRDDRDIYLVATNGSGEWRRLTDGGRNLAPSYSPDGQWIVFTSYREGDDAELFLMRPDGSDVRQLTFNDYTDWQPRWGPQ